MRRNCKIASYHKVIGKKVIEIDELTKEMFSHLPLEIYQYFLVNKVLPKGHQNPLGM
jgi:hypothetical protein